jgi:hypothetical protein
VTRNLDAGTALDQEGEIEPKVEFLFWQGCPSHPQALQRLQEVMADVGVVAPIEQIEVRSDEEAERLSFPGSPTIRVGGVDVDPVGAARTGTALTCRVYLLEDGRFSPLPSKAMIERALLG